MEATQTCYFNGCMKPISPGLIKCDFHRNRSHCRVPECRNQVFARHLCVSHGGRNPCQHEGCEANARIHGLCSRHGGKAQKKLCSEPGCTNLVHSNRKCVRHGGGRPCKVIGCQTRGRTGGFCYHHFTAERRKSVAVEQMVGQSSNKNRITPKDPKAQCQRESYVLPPAPVFLPSYNINQKLIESTMNSNEYIRCASYIDSNTDIAQAASALFELPRLRTSRACQTRGCTLQAFGSSNHCIQHDQAPQSSLEPLPVHIELTSILKEEVYRVAPLQALPQLQVKPMSMAALDKALAENRCLPELSELLHRFKYE
jgi:hypothetical protein